MPNVPAVGEPAPEFTLRGPGGASVSLSDYRGHRPVVLVFYPLAFSPVCSHQLPQLEQALPRMRELGAEVLGISVDSHYANAAFARELGLSFPLLSDFHRRTSEGYGVLRAERGISGRATFVVDKEGRIAHAEVSDAPGDLAKIPSHERVIEALQRLA